MITPTNGSNNNHRPVQPTTSAAASAKEPSHIEQFVKNALPLAAAAGVLGATRPSTVTRAFRMGRQARSYLQTNWYLSKSSKVNVQAAQGFRAAATKFISRAGIVTASTIQSIAAVKEDASKPKIAGLGEAHNKELQTLVPRLKETVRYNKTTHALIEQQLKMIGEDILFCDPVAQFKLQRAHKELTERYEERRRTTEAELVKVLTPLVTIPSNSVTGNYLVKDVITKTAAGLAEVGLCLTLGRFNAVKGLCQQLGQLNIINAKMIEKIVVGVGAYTAGETIEAFTSPNATLHDVNAVSGQMLPKLGAPSAAAPVPANEHPVIHHAVNVLTHAISRVAPEHFSEYMPAEVLEVGAEALFKTEVHHLIPELTHAKVQAQIQKNLKPLKDKHTAVMNDTAVAINDTRAEIATLQAAVKAHVPKPVATHSLSDDVMKVVKGKPVHCVVDDN